jgi:endo-1,4-beta-D-glucanase Y
MSRSAFPLDRRFPACTYPQHAKIEDVERAVGRWRDEIVTGSGARGFLRTRRPDTPDGVPDSTVSEGIAYGMLIAVMLGDQELFDGLFRYALSFFNKSGLMDWYIAPDGSAPLGHGAATDADEDMAWALLMADRRWGGKGALERDYLSHGKQLIDAIWRTEVDHEQYTDMLLPGDDWRGQNVFNPSYFAPHQYRAFAEVTANQGWLRVIDRGYEIIDRCQSPELGNQHNGLVPAWCDASGRPVEAFPGALTNHQYDSARLPFRLGQDWAYHEEPRARRYLAKVSEFYAKIGPNRITDGYLLDGTPAPDPRAQLPSPGSAVFVGGAAVAAMHDARYQGFVDEAYALLATGELLARSRYYNECWTVLSLLMLTGNLVPL